MLVCDDDVDAVARTAFVNSLPFASIDDADAKTRLRQAFNPKDSPVLVLLNAATGQVVNQSAQVALTIDPSGSQFPAGVWDSSSKTSSDTFSEGEERVVRFGMEHLSALALDEHQAGRLSREQLAAIRDLVIDLSAKLEELAVARADLRKSLPAQVRAVKNAKYRPYPHFELLMGTGEDDYRGRKSTQRKPDPIDLLSVPERSAITDATKAVQAMEACLKICQQLIQRAEDSNSPASQRLAIQHETLQLISHLFISVIPMPMPPDVNNDACIWQLALPRAMQLRGLHVTYQLMYQLGALWQDIEEPDRLFDCQRALTALCAYALFDVLLRTPAADFPLAISDLLNDNGGVQLYMCISWGC